MTVIFISVFVNYLTRTTSPFLEGVQRGVFQHCLNWACQAVPPTALEYKNYLVVFLLNCLTSKPDALSLTNFIDGEGNLEGIFDTTD